MSLDAPLISEGENNFTLMDTVEQSEYLSTDDEIMRQSLKDEIAISMSMLDERQRDVLKYYFGLDGHSPYSLEAIAEKLGLTRERARQIKEGAVKRLKKSSRSEKLKMYLG
jgi:RNA polymerase primary sigma factor